jgi:hypothetical protein
MDSNAELKGVVIELRHGQGLLWSKDAPTMIKFQADAFPCMQLGQVVGFSPGQLNKARAMVLRRCGFKDGKVKVGFALIKMKEFAFQPELDLVVTKAPRSALPFTQMGCNELFGSILIPASPFFALGDKIKVC